MPGGESELHAFHAVGEGKWEADVSVEFGVYVKEEVAF